MPENRRKSPPRDPVPDQFSSIEDFWAFWDSHSSADYEDLMEEVEIKVGLQGSRFFCAVARDVMEKLRMQAHQQGVSAETLINLWLKEKVAEVEQNH